MKNNALKIILAVLVLLALGLGVAIYMKKKPSSSGGTTQTNNTTTTASNDLAIFQTPGKDATKAQLDAYANLVSTSAVDGDTVTVKDCTATPQVLRTKYGNTITVKNTGKSDIHFGFDAERTLVSAGKSVQVKTNFKNGAGIYGYGCDDTSVKRSIGLLLLSQ